MECKHKRLFRERKEQDKQDGRSASCNKSDAAGEQQADTNIPFVEIAWLTLGEAGIVLWITAEFLSSVARPKIGVCCLGVSVIFFFLYVDHKFYGSDWGRKNKTLLRAITSLLCLLVVIVCVRAVMYFDTKWKSENEPQVFPSIAQLGDGTNAHITRVIISNPSDSWIYGLVLLIQVKDNAVPISSVSSFIADTEHSDDFLNTNRFSADPNRLLTPDFPIPDLMGFDKVYPKSEGRFLSLYSLAPKENRALWIEGTYPSNSFAYVSVFDHANKPQSIIIDTNSRKLIIQQQFALSKVQPYLPEATSNDFSFALSVIPPQLPVSAFAHVQLAVENCDHGSRAAEGGRLLNEKYLNFPSNILALDSIIGLVELPVPLAFTNAQTRFWLVNDSPNTVTNLEVNILIGRDVHFVAQTNWVEVSLDTNSLFRELRYLADKVVPDEKLPTPAIMFSFNPFAHFPVIVGAVAQNMTPLCWGFNLLLLPNTNITQIHVMVEKHNPTDPQGVMRGEDIELR